MVVASAAALVAAQCVEAAEAMGTEREHQESVVAAVSVRMPGDIITLTAAAATGEHCCKKRTITLKNGGLWQLTVV